MGPWNVRLPIILDVRRILQNDSMVTVLCFASDHVVCAFQNYFRELDDNDEGF